MTFYTISPPVATLKATSLSSQLLSHCQLAAFDLCHDALFLPKDESISALVFLMMTAAPHMTVDLPAGSVDPHG